MDREDTIWGIGEVAQKLGYSTSNIRRLDRIGALPASGRVSGGRRFWRRRDVEKFRIQLDTRRSKAAA